jgi:hypothetical protein
MRVLTRAGAFGLIFSGLLLVTSPAWSDPWGPAWSDRGPDYSQNSAPGGGQDQGWSSDPCCPDQAGPAYGAQAEGSGSQPKDTAQACERMLSDAPGGSSSGLDISMSAGKTALPGDAISTKLTWDRMEWPGSRIDQVVDCVTVGGKLDAGLSALEKPTMNDGKFEHSFTVPAGLPEGTKVCGRGFLSGEKGPGVYCQNSTDAMCFVVGAAPTPPKVTPAPAAPTQVMGRQVQALPAPAIPVRQAAAPAPVAQPAPAPAPAVEPELAATGPLNARPLVLSSGFALMLGGLGVIAGTRRRARPSA